jgi:hypothetical protein
MNQQIDKPDYNEEFRVCDFSTVLESSDSITAQTVSITDSNGVDCTATMISDAAVYTGNKGVRYKLKGGISGSKYELEIKISTASLQKFIEPFTVCII